MKRAKFTRVKRTVIQLGGTLTYKGIDGLKTGLHRFVHGFARNNAGSLELNSLSLVGHNGTFAIDGLTKGVDDATEHAGANWNIDNGTSSLHNISFLNFSV